MCSLLASLLLAIPASTRAYVDNNVKWWGAVKYWVDTASAQHLYGHGVSGTEFNYLVAYAFGEWKHRSGAALSFDYRGTKSANCQDPWSNTIGVLNGCLNNDCSRLGQAFHETNPSTGEITTASMCIARGNLHDWEARVAEVGSLEKDLAATLIHEAGHFLGITALGTGGHYHLTAMKSGHYPDSSVGRIITDADVEGIRAKYGTTLRQVYAQNVDSGAVTFIGGGLGGGPYATGRVDADIGYINGSSGLWMVWTTREADGTKQWFSRRQLPLSNQQTPGNSTLVTDAGTPAGIAANWLNGGSARWVAAWFDGPIGHTWCFGIGCWAPIENDLRVAVSNNGFQTLLSSQTLTASSGSYYKPSVAYHRGRNRFYILYLNGGGWGDHPWDIEYFVSDSTVTSWSGPHKLGYKALDTPDMDCTTSDCVIVYSRASSDLPTTVARHLTTDANGLLIPGSYLENTHAYPFHSPSIGMRNPGYPPYLGEAVIARTAAPAGNYDLVAEGGGNLAYYKSLALPPTVQNTFTATSATYLANPAVVATFPHITEAYFVYTE